jgi:phosphoribosylanthranilate isomerase
MDSHVPGSWGGTGQRFDWQLAAAHPHEPPLVLSGGLDPENVAEAIEVAQPFAVDVASGVEAEPGRKDPELMRRFFDAVERAAAPV